MSQITYLIGDATYPIGTGLKIIAHVCNAAGGWGAGFVMSLSKRWKAPEECYREWTTRALGKVQFVLTGLDHDTVVANMVGQVLGGPHPPIRYGALATCLTKVAEFTHPRSDASVHMPRIGCGLAGGTWDKVEPLIQEHLCKAGVPVFVYDLPK